MLGIIDVGGGLRGIYGAGFLDYCMDREISFDYCIGVSAGSANLAAYIAGQKGRNYRFYHDYAFRKDYMGICQYRKTGSYINLDYDQNYRGMIMAARAKYEVEQNLSAEDESGDTDEDG